MQHGYNNSRNLSLTNPLARITEQEFKVEVSQRSSGPSQEDEWIKVVKQRKHSLAEQNKKNEKARKLTHDRSKKRMELPHCK